MNVGLIPGVIMGRVRAHIRQQFVGYLALFIAVGGVSYAATSLPAGSVGTKQLKKHAVTLSKISNKARAALHGQTGQQGAKGDTGTQGPTGATGQLGPKGDPGPTYSAGSGLLLANNSFSFDPSVVQSRVGSCAAYKFIASVAANGAPSCDYPTAVDSANYRPVSDKSISNDNQHPTTIVSTTVGAAHYAVTASLTLDNTTSSPVSVECDIAASDPTSFLVFAYAVLPAAIAGGGTATLSLQGWQNSTVVTTDTLSCDQAGAANAVTTAATPLGTQGITGNLTATLITAQSGLTSSG